jgi:hypothetical protein
VAAARRERAIFPNVNPQPIMNDRTKAILENNPALRVLAEIDNGGLASELANELTGLVQASMAHGRAGEMTVKITVKPTGANKYEINAEAKPKPAKEKRTATTFFADEHFQLLRTDPNQKEIEFERVPKGAAAR